jgi:alkylated DNA repair dioxygenase AlkB
MTTIEDADTLGAEDEEVQKLPDGVEHLKLWLPEDDAKELFEFGESIQAWDNYSEHREKPGPGAQDVAWAGYEWTRDGRLIPVGDGTLPPVLQKQASRIEREAGFKPVQFQINRFLPGYGVAWHSDIHPGVPMEDEIEGGGKTIALSVGGPRLQLFHHMPEEWKGHKGLMWVDHDPEEDFEPELEIVLEDRDATVLTHQFQKDWIHALVDRVLKEEGRRTIRYSFVARSYPKKVLRRAMAT